MRALLSCLPSLRLEAVVVGRKFEPERCRRALCGDGREGAATSVLGSALRLEATTGGGQAGQLHFGDGDESLCWAIGDAAVSRHDGRTGRPLDAEWGAVSPMCSRVLRAEVERLRNWSA